MPDTTETVFTSMPATAKFAMKVVRKWQQLPDELNDDQALSQGLITPEMLQLIMQIVNDLMQNCLQNSKSSALQRVRSYLGNTKPTDKLGDQVRINWIVDRWMNRLGVPRDLGDVVAIRKAIEDNANGMQDEEFFNIQSEALWLTV